MDHNPLPRTIGVGIDGSVESSHVLSWALALAAGLGARLVVAHGSGLLEGAGFRPPVDLGAEVTAARGLLPPDQRPPEVVLVSRPGHPVDVLLTVALEHDVDLLAVGRRGAGRNLAAFGSTSDGILRGASVPVVVFPSTY
jgi:nucleotide-binding universal stress UspA family protein